jgi:hypothetical protein
MLSAGVGAVISGDFVGERSIKVGTANTEVEVEMGFVVTTVVGIGAIFLQAPNRITLRIRTAGDRFLITLTQNIETHFHVCA